MSSWITRSSNNVHSSGSLLRSHHSDSQLQTNEVADEVALHIRRMAGTLPDLVRVAQQRLVAQRDAEAANMLYFTCGFCFLVTLSAALLYYAIARDGTLTLIILFQVWRPTMGKTDMDIVPSTTTQSTPRVSSTSGSGGPGTAVTTGATT
ncbi:hypothetical protein MRX96_022286 [Rhipicephalus microplus]